MKTKLFIYCFLITVIYSCKSTEDAIQIEQQISKYPIVIIGDTIKKQRIFRIMFPIGFKIKNNSFQERSLFGIGYYYNNFHNAFLYSTGWDSGGAILYKVENNEDLIRVGKSSSNDIRKINRYQTIQYIAYTRHSIDTSQVYKPIFEPYLEKMKALKQDTLHIGCIGDLEKKYPGFVQEFLQGDSIEFSFWGKKNEPKVIIFPIPVKYEEFYMDN